MRLSAQPFLWKWVLFARDWKIISISKAEQLTSFWYRGPGELGSGLLIITIRYVEKLTNGKGLSVSVRVFFLSAKQFSHVQPHSTRWVIHHCFITSNYKWEKVIFLLTDSRGMTWVLSSARTMACPIILSNYFIQKKIVSPFALPWTVFLNFLSVCINTKTVPKIEVNKINSRKECDAVLLWARASFGHHSPMGKIK